MRTSLIITGVLILLFIAFQTWAAMSTNKTEQYSYTILQDFQTFEASKYESIIFAKTRIDAETYRRGSCNGFKTLASYIFGGNEPNESIAMSSPFAMNWGEGMAMELMMPSKYTPENLPTPNRNDIEIYKKPTVIMAGLNFSGFSSDQKIQEKIQELQVLFEKENIAHTGHFQFFGYNPPYQMFNRRNNIVVELIGLE